MNVFKTPISFSSSRSNFREFGVFCDGKTFYEKHDFLKHDLMQLNADELLSNEYKNSHELKVAIRSLPEFEVYRHAIHEDGLSFAAFRKTGVRVNNEGNKEKFVSEKDIEHFVLERIQHQYSKYRTNFEFVMEHEGNIIGYVSLFDFKIVPGRSSKRRLEQLERGIFILPRVQGKGYGKEGVIAITDFALNKLEVDQVFTMTDPENNHRSMNNIIKNTGARKIAEADAPQSYDGDKRFHFIIEKKSFENAVEFYKNRCFLIIK